MVDNISISKEQAGYFKDEFRNAREEAFEDSEGYQKILFTLERFGAFLYNKFTSKEGKKKDEKFPDGLGKYAKGIKEFVKLADCNDNSIIWQTSFEKLYEIIREARNDALHQGVFARHLTENAVYLALILEEALVRKGELNLVGDLMVKNPICAALWQPVSLIRQQMLLHSFSYLPFLDESKNEWRLVSDQQIVKYLSSGDKKAKLKKELKEAIDDGLHTDTVDVNVSEEKISSIIKKSDGKPILVKHSRIDNVLIGIITPFDLL